MVSSKHDTHYLSYDQVLRISTYYWEGIPYPQPGDTMDTYVDWALEIVASTQQYLHDPSNFSLWIHDVHVEAN